MTQVARREYLRAWRAAHPGYSREWSRENRAYQQEYRRTHLEYIQQCNQRRHTRRQRVYRGALSHHRVLRYLRVVCDVCGRLVEHGHSQEGHGFRCAKHCDCGKDGTK